MIQALRCFVELPMFILVGLIGKQVSAKKLILAGICFSLVYIIGLLFAKTLFWLLFFHLVGSPGFILGLSGRMRYLNEITPLSVRSTSITVMVACEIGLSAVAGNLIAGFLLEMYGTYALTLVALGALFAVMLILSFLPGKATAS